MPALVPSLANPAVTLARPLTDTFARGIAAGYVPGVCGRADLAALSLLMAVCAKSSLAD